MEGSGLLVRAQPLCATPPSPTIPPSMAVEEESWSTRRPWLTSPSRAGTTTAPRKRRERSFSGVSVDESFISIVRARGSVTAGGERSN